MNTVPVISRAEYAQRRARVLQQLGAEHVAILNAASLQVRNRDAEFIFRQDSDFHYLTGFDEPEAVVVLIPNRVEGEFVLFCRPRDEKAERWTGLRAGVEGAVRQYGADQAFPISELEQRLPELLANRSAVHYRLGADWEFDKKVLGWLNAVRAKARNGIQAPETLHNIDNIVHEMRLFKSAEELAVMRYAAQVSARAHTRAMQACQAGKHEFEIEAEILHDFRHAGMELAYSSIVGGGQNACILHYIENRALLQDGDLLLIDAGAEHQCYASDITRTFPVNGRFSPEQKALYEVVLIAQLAAIAAVKPGKSWNDPHQAATHALVDGLLQLGLLEGTRESVLEKRSYERFYMHKTGHWLGMDVHDVGAYKVNGQWRTLAAGMVLTVEPGLYISPAEDINKKWWNIGIRIEDDVLVTEAGCEVITSSVVKSVMDIERLMARHA